MSDCTDIDTVSERGRIAVSLVIHSSHKGLINLLAPFSTPTITRTVCTYVHIHAFRTTRAGRPMSIEVGQYQALDFVQVLEGEVRDIQFTVEGGEHGCGGLSRWGVSLVYPGEVDGYTAAPTRAARKQFARDGGLVDFWEIGGSVLGVQEDVATMIRSSAF